MFSNLNKVDVNYTNEFLSNNQELSAYVIFRNGKLKLKKYVI